MELLTFKDRRQEYTYYLDKNGEGVRHGEYKNYRANGKLWEHYFSYHGECHGEYKEWDHAGVIFRHVFYINDERLPAVEMNEQEKLLFQIQYPGFRFIEK